MQIRPARPPEQRAIESLVAEAFGEPPDGPLVQLLRALDASGAVRASLVAVDGDRIIGHVQLNRCWLDAPRALVEVLVLSPLSVDPRRQRHGVGTALVQAALDEARRLGAPAVFLEGSQHYYGRRGFQAAAPLGFLRPSNRIPEPAFQVALLPAYEPWMTGQLIYCDAFWATDVVGLRDRAPVPSPAAPPPAPVWVVAGPPGAGKSTVARLLARTLDPPGAVLDKDTLYSGFVAATLQAAGRPYGEREGPWYNENIKTHEYGGLVAAAREIRGNGCPAILVAPFTSEIHDVGRWAAFVDALGGAPVHLVWLRIDPATLRQRLIARADPRDTGKLANFEAFVTAIRAGQVPPVPHFEVDNRPPGTEPLAATVAAIVATAQAQFSSDPSTATAGHPRSTAGRT
jgi:predicted N-acetyltransferase YhbS/predicted kinase